MGVYARVYSKELGYYPSGMSPSFDGGLVFENAQRRKPSPFVSKEGHEKRGR